MAWSASLSHPHVLQFLGASTRRTPFMIVTELAVGSLQSLAELPVQPGLDRATELALQVAYGLGYMHERKPYRLVHGDLNPGNLLLVGGSGAQDHERLSDALLKNGVLKIADFGSATIMDPLGVKGHGRGWLDPAVGGQISWGGGYGVAKEFYRVDEVHKVDVYGFSLTTFLLFEGRLPTEPSGQAAAPEGARPAFRKKVGEKDKFHTPEPIRKLIADCWQHDPNLRPEVREIIARLTAFRNRLRDQQKKAAARIASMEMGIWVKGVQAGDLPGFTLLRDQDHAQRR